MTVGLAERATAALQTAGLDPVAVRELVVRALDEDLGLGPDVTSNATVPAEAIATAAVVSRGLGIVAGAPVALAVLAEVDPSLRADVGIDDGSPVSPGDAVMEVSGSARSLLLAERTMLNFLGHLSGVASVTRSWVDAVAGTEAVIRDTRKTTPGLRSLEKYAVRCGGGSNHRLGLGDAALVKDNHIAAAGGVTAAVTAVRGQAAAVPLEVECDTVEQVREAIDAGARLLLLDNMAPAQLRAAVELAAPRGVATEASGGLTLDTAGDVAATGVTYISVGALTHSAPVLDLGLDFC
jgi:nicotinate-nucleotide pyrophosphorylase (carboxylating)